LHPKNTSFTPNHPAANKTSFALMDTITSRKFIPVRQSRQVKSPLQAPVDPLIGLTF
jgi:hypothetical protein